MENKYSVICIDDLDRLIIFDWNDTDGILTKRPALFNLNKLKNNKMDMTYEDMKMSKADVYNVFVDMYKDNIELLGDIHHVYNAYKNALMMCKNQVKKYKLKSYILFGEVKTSDEYDDTKIVSFRFNGKVKKETIRVFSEQQKILDTYSDIIVRLFKYDLKILKKLENLGYYSTILHPSIDSKNIEYRISNNMFNKVNFGKHCIYKKDSNIKLESKRFTLFKDISTPVECSNILNEYKLNLEAINRYNDILKHLSLEDLSRAVDIQTDILTDRINHLQKSIDEYKILIDAIMDASIEQRSIREFISLDIGVNHNDDNELEFTYGYTSFTLSDIYELNGLIRNIAIHKVKNIKNNENLIDIIKKSPCPIIEDAKITLLYADIKNDVKSNRIAAVSLNRKKICDRLASAIKVGNNGEIKLKFTQDFGTELNLYGNPLNGSCRCILGNTHF